MIEFTCADCGKTFRTGEEHAGQRFACRGCGTTMTVPTLRSEPPLPVGLPVGDPVPAAVEPAAPPGVSSIDVVCPLCQAEIYVPLECADQVMVCPVCNQDFTAPDRQTALASLAAPPAAPPPLGTFDAYFTTAKQMGQLGRKLLTGTITVYADRILLKGASGDSSGAIGGAVAGGLVGLLIGTAIDKAMSRTGRHTVRPEGRQAFYDPQRRRVNLEAGPGLWYDIGANKATFPNLVSALGQVYGDRMLSAPLGRLSAGRKAALWIILTPLALFILAGLIALIGAAITGNLD